MFRWERFPCAQYAHTHTQIAFHFEILIPSVSFALEIEMLRRAHNADDARLWTVAHAKFDLRRL